MWSLPLLLPSSHTCPHLSDLGPWFLYADSHGFYFFSISLPPTSDRIVRTALGRNLPCFDLEKLLLNFSRDTEPEEHKKVESSWLSSDHESMPDACKRKSSTKKDRDGNTLRAQSLSELSSECHRFGGQGRGGWFQRPLDRENLLTCSHSQPFTVLFTALQF